jgi:hypothetical protein
MSKIIVNVSTGEIIERELNDDELAQQAIDEAAEAARRLELAAKAQARQVILERLGLTEEEARLLLG